MLIDAYQKKAPDWRVASKYCLLNKAMSLTLLFALATGALSIQAQAQAASEYQVKAAFLFNFVKFVEWPADAFSSEDAPLVIGVIGEDPFGSALDQAINGKYINGRQLTIRRLRFGEGLRACHVLFISSSEQKRLGQIFDSA